MIRLTVLTLVLISGCGSQPTRDLNRVFGYGDSLEAFKRATAFNAFRSAEKDDPNSYTESLEQFRSTAPSIDLTENQKAELRDILLDPTSYLWDGASGCIPDFGIRVQYQHGNDTFNILFCFQCNLLEITKNGKTVGGGLFAPSRRQLVLLMQELFPDDNEIRALE